jgi:hypothetical protein
MYGLASMQRKLGIAGRSQVGNVVWSSICNRQLAHTFRIILDSNNASCRRTLFYSRPRDLWKLVTN